MDVDLPTMCALPGEHYPHQDMQLPIRIDLMICKNRTSQGKKQKQDRHCFFAVKVLKEERKELLQNTH